VTTERSLGREETRCCYSALLPECMRRFVRDWKGLTSIGQVITATEPHFGGKFETQTNRFARNTEFLESLLFD
jgi:hypothetical protein